MARPNAVVATPTTMAVRINTCGSGLLYAPAAASTAASAMGALPPATLPKVM